MSVQKPIDTVNNTPPSMEENTDIGEEDEIKLVFIIPSGKKLVLTASKNLSLKTCLNNLAAIPFLNMSGLIYIYIEGEECSFDDFHNPLKNTNLYSDVYIHITKNQRDASEKMSIDFVGNICNYDVTMGDDTPVYHELEFETVLKGNINILNRRETIV